MDYHEARQLVMNEKMVPNYLELEIGYYCKLILPYKEGINVLNALQSAEMRDEYSNDYRIMPVQADKIKATVLSARQYQRHKIAALLNLKLSDLDEAEKASDEEAIPTT